MKLRYYMRGLGIGILVTAIMMSFTSRGKTQAMSDEDIMARARELGMEKQYDNTVLADMDSENNVSENSALKSLSLLNGQDEAEEGTEAQNALDRARQSIENSQKAVEADEKADVAAEQAETLNTDFGAGADLSETGTSNRDAADTDKSDALTGEGKADADENDTPTGEGKADADENDTPTGESKEDEDKSDTDAGQQVQIVIGSGDDSLSVAKMLQQAGLIADAAAFDRYLCQNGYDKRICSGTHTFVQGASDDEIAKELTRKVK